MDARGGRSRRRAQKNAIQRRAIEAGRRSQKHLAQVSRPAADVPSNQIRIMPFHLHRSHQRTRSNAVLEAGSKSFHLVFNRLSHVASESVWHMAVTPCRVLARRSTGWIK